MNVQVGQDGERHGIGPETDIVGVNTRYDFL